MTPCPPEGIDPRRFAARGSVLKVYLSFFQGTPQIGIFKFPCANSFCRTESCGGSCSLSLPHATDSITGRHMCLEISSYQHACCQQIVNPFNPQGFIRQTIGASV